LNGLRNQSLSLCPARPLCTRHAPRGDYLIITRSYLPPGHPHLVSISRACPTSCLHTYIIIASSGEYTLQVPGVLCRNAFAGNIIQAATPTISPWSRPFHICPGTRSYTVFLLVAAQDPLSTTNFLFSNAISCHHQP
jgi:hypothetical protein